MSNSIYSRRSIRKYLKTPVPKEMIEQVIDAARMAPSAKNRQPWKYIVFGGEQKKELLTQMEIGIKREESEEAFLQNSKQGIPDAKNTLKIMKEAPVIIVVLNTNGNTPFQGGIQRKRRCKARPRKRYPFPYPLL